MSLAGIASVSFESPDLRLYRVVGDHGRVSVFLDLCVMFVQGNTG